MFSFLGELIALVVWLIQSGLQVLQTVLPAMSGSVQAIGSRPHCVPVSTVRRLANGPPGDWGIFESGWSISPGTATFASRLLPRR